MATKKKLSHKSLLYESEQRLIKSGITKLYNCAGDEVYFSLKSPEEMQAMEKRSLSVVNSHNYLSINNKYVEESFEGIQEKLKINSRHKERYVKFKITVVNMSAILSNTSLHSSLNY